VIAHWYPLLDRVRITGHSARVLDTSKETPHTCSGGELIPAAGGDPERTGAAVSRSGAPIRQQGDELSGGLAEMVT
jgi:hypothetical protein